MWGARFTKGTGPRALTSRQPYASCALVVRARMSAVRALFLAVPPILDGLPRDSFGSQLDDEAVHDPSARPRSLPRGHERVIVNCETKAVPPDPRSFQTSPGVHRASIRATFADGSYLDTPEVEFELRCDGADTPRTADAAVSTSDPSASVLSAPDAGPSPSSSPAQRAEGGCVVSRDSERTALPLRALALLFVCGLFALRRRRVRATRH